MKLKLLKFPLCIYVTISFSLAVNIYILLFIYEPLYATVKCDVRDKIYRMITVTPKQ